MSAQRGARTESCLATVTPDYSVFNFEAEFPLLIGMKNQNQV